MVFVRHFGCKDLGGSANARAAMNRRTARSAFTLIELLVVIAIIALLISILLPSLSAAREQARAAVCAGHLHGLGNGLAAYASEYKDYIPGTNTSGVALRAMAQKIASDPKLLHDRRLPVQQWDWISPLINLEDGISGNRAERFQMLTNRYSCPSQASIESVLYVPPGQGMPDEEEFRQQDAKEKFQALSYLMPVYFQFWGRTSRGAVLSKIHMAEGVRTRENVEAMVAPNNWEVRVDSFNSQLGRVGPPSKKIAAADGTRYLPPSGILDHDVTLFPSLFGSFTCSGAWWAGSTAYGVRAASSNWDDRRVPIGSPSRGRNLDLTYRHGKPGGSGGDAHLNRGTINALFFDGHVARLSDQESRNIDYWYPKGSKPNSSGIAQGMTNIDRNYEVP